MHESAFVLGRTWANHFERRIGEQPGELTVAMLRKWMDEPKPKGLPRELQDLVILVFADQSQRTFFLSGAPFKVDVGPIRDELVLRSQQLPPEDTWRRASERANVVFGWAGGSHRTAANVASLIEALRKREGELREAARTLRDVLLGRLQTRGIPEAESSRFATARAAVDLLEAVRKAPETQVCEAFAGMPVPASEQALARSLSSAADVVRALGDTRWEALDQALRLSGRFLVAAEALSSEVDEALRKDELAVGLRNVLETAEKRALKLTGDYLASTKPAPETKEPPLPPPSPGVERAGSRVVVEEDSREVGDAASARRLFSELETKLSKQPGTRLKLRWTIEREGGKR
jgi:hypothetical protein